MFRLIVRGVVQGVGFRPFVYRLATSMGLKGYVKNTGDGTVEILIDRDVEEFVERLKREKPPIAQVSDVRVEKVERKLFNTFFIEKSGGKRDELSLPPPDVAVCEKCLKELFDPDDRRYRYPFISCTDCGPRFCIAVSLPYDRENTTLGEFPLCEECRKEYDNVEDRRYFAQSIACGKCGPDYRLMDRQKIISRGYEAIKETAKLLDSGYVIAIKGLGGFHMASVTDDELVFKLRKLLGREQQPFALMARDIESIKRVAKVSDLEEKELKSFVRPITILKKREKDSFYAVAPKLDTIGVMLPYAPIHHLLFQNLKADFLVMTSANLPGEPMFIDDSVFELPIDFALTHNLRISNRVDDSVVKVINGRRMIIRRSRGFVPNAFFLDSKLTCIALGAELYNSISMLKDGQVIQSQYIGNTANFKTFNEFFKQAFSFFKSFLKMEKIDAIFCDLHPLYNTSSFAEKISKELSSRLIRIQHHFAHGMSVMAERNLEKAVSISVDGVGYGFDGSVWGGEVLLIDFEKMRFDRIGRLEEFKLLGGDLAARYPLRILFSLIFEQLGDYGILERYEKYLRDNESFEIFARQFEREINVFKATSMGRMLDAMASMLEICMERTYEGEPAMKLEALARDLNPESNPDVKSDMKPDIENVKPRIELVREESSFPPFVENDEVKIGKREVAVLKTKAFFADCLERYLEGESRKKIASEFVQYLAKGLAEIAAREKLPIVLSGGVAYNELFTSEVEKSVKEKGLEFYTNETTAAGDNGISFGQIYLAKFLE
ncbi:MAG: carbamoyltransferase HypF [Archaeoglobus sp.]|nr:carbamoyltransferase HypF [Archaeoglobus sp.]